MSEPLFDSEKLLDAEDSEITDSDKLETNVDEKKTDIDEQDSDAEIETEDDIQDNGDMESESELPKDPLSENVTDKNEISKEPAIKNMNLPISKIKSIVKLGIECTPNIKQCSAESLFLISKTTEYFIQNLAKESYNAALQKKKKTLKAPDVQQALAMLPVEL